MQAEKPILFSTPMVKAIIAGRKTQTRRIMKMSRNNDIFCGLSNDPDVSWPADYGFGALMGRAFYDNEAVKCPWQVGDRLYVRETWGELTDYCDHPELPGCPTERWSLGYRYRADNYEHKQLDGFWTGWKPSIHMPKLAARIWLEVTDIRVERLQDISEEDAKAEGVYMGPADDPIDPPDYSYCPKCGGQGVHASIGENYGVTEVDCTTCDTYKKRFEILWNQINGPESWKSNPFVWVINFNLLSTSQGKGKIKRV